MTVYLSVLAGRNCLVIKIPAFVMVVFWAMLTYCGYGLAVDSTHFDVKISHLKSLERRLLPDLLVSGEPRCEELVEYYWDANPKLQLELNSAKGKFNRSEGDRKLMTLVAGPAGVGKTFIKRGVCDGLPDEVLWKFDARELFREYRDGGFAEHKADLHDGSTVFNQLLALTHAGRQRFRRQVLTSEASLIVVDSLDEIHPRDYVFVLETLEKLVHRSEQEFAHVVVFGRPFCFDAYWRQRDQRENRDFVHGFMLRKPEFRTTGDIQVSNWNFDLWKFELRRQSAGQQQRLSFSDYQDWCNRGFLCDGKFSDVVFDANQHMTVEARAMLNRCIAEEPTVAAVISNLAANGMVREILLEQLNSGRSFDEQRFMEDFLTRWLMRDTKSDDRPSQMKPEYLDVYLNLLETVAVKYSGSVQADGSFAIANAENVEVEFNGSGLTVSVTSLLNRSGLVTAEPFGEATGRVRFEPLWLHRFLISRHARRLSGDNLKQTPVALR